MERFWPRWVSGKLGDAAQPKCRRDAGHHVDRNASGFQCGLFFATTAKDIGIAAFQAHNTQALPCFGNQDVIDFGLLGRRLKGRFADRNAHGIAAGHFQNAGRNETVIRR